MCSTALNNSLDIDPIINLKKPFGRDWSVCILKILSCLVNVILVGVDEDGGTTFAFHKIMHPTSTYQHLQSVIVAFDTINIALTICKE
jgi:hypothetical protein